MVKKVLINKLRKYLENILMKSLNLFDIEIKKIFL